MARSRDWHLLLSFDGLTAIANCDLDVTVSDGERTLTYTVPAHATLLQPFQVDVEDDDA